MFIRKVAELIFKRCCEQFIAALSKLRKGLLASSRISVLPSLRMEQFGSQWPDLTKYHI
jgi:hypothetical protein